MSICFTGGRIIRRIFFIFGCTSRRKDPQRNIGRLEAAFIIIL